MNHRPIITDQTPLATEEETSLTITLDHLRVSDPDHIFPDDFTLEIHAGENYLLSDSDMATGQQTLIPEADFDGVLTVPVTVSDSMDVSEPFPLKIHVTAVNDRPIITGQIPLPLQIGEDTRLAIIWDHLTVTDPDSPYPDVFTLALHEGEDYTFEENEITPAPEFSGTLTIPVTVSDGELEGEPFLLEVSVTPENDPPVITGQRPLYTSEDTPLTIVSDDVTVDDPDHLHPDAFLLTVMDGQNYTLSENSIRPAEGFTGTLSVPVIVNDGAADSAPFQLEVMVGTDADQDGMPDTWEMTYRLDPFFDDADEDADGDGHANLNEYLHGTDPMDADSWPHPPEADAGADQIVAEGRTVTLDSSGSSDPKNDIAGYLWEQTTGISAVLSDPSDPKPTFVTPPVRPEGTVLTFRLTLTDEHGWQGSDTVTMQINDNGITDFPHDALPFRTATGEPVAIKVLSGGDLTGLYVIHPDEIPAADDTPTSLIYGLIEMQIKCSDELASPVVRVYFPDPLPQDDAWFGYSSILGWQDWGPDAAFNETGDQITVSLRDRGEDAGTNRVVHIGGPNIPSSDIDLPVDSGEDNCFISASASGGAFSSARTMVGLALFFALAIGSTFAATRKARLLTKDQTGAFPE